MLTILKIEILENEFGVVLIKSCAAEQLSSFHRLKQLASKQRYKIIKKLILNKTSFSVAETHFCQTKILKISYLKTFT